MIQIEEIIAAGESLTVEFKQGLSSTDEKGICKEIAALATTQGGYLLIGVDDEGTICGVDNPKGIIEKIEGWTQSYVNPTPKIDCSITTLAGKKRHTNYR